MDFFKNVTYYLDLFKSPVYLFFNSKSKVQTTFSFLVSLGIILFLIVFFFHSDLFLKKNPISSTQSISTNARPQLDFNYDNMAMAFSLSDPDDTILNDDTIFSFEMVTYIVDGAGEVLDSEVKKLEFCKESDFKTHGSVFNDLNLKHAWCPTTGNFTLKGYWDEKLTKYVVIDLIPCNNKTSNNTCKSNEEMYDHMQNIYFNIYFSDNIIDVNDYQSPINMIYKKRYFLVDTNIYKKLTMYFKKVKFITDNGLVFSNEILSESWLYDNYEIDYRSLQKEVFAYYILLQKFMQSLEDIKNCKRLSLI